MAFLQQTNGHGKRQEILESASRTQMIKIKVYEMERCQVKVYTIIMELVSPSQTPTQKAGESLGVWSWC